MWSLQLHGMPVAVAGDIPHHMQTCSHEEANTRMLIHLQDALDNGAWYNTDVAAIFVGKFHKLLERNPAAKCIAGIWSW